MARECARFILPQHTTTTLYMTGDVRSWLHYLALRTRLDVQPEHRAVARDCQQWFCYCFPKVAQAFGWAPLDQAPGASVTFDPLA